MRAVILNGDDFGLAEAINQGILEAHEHGCLTSASLSVAGPAVASAVAGAARCPALGVGLHLTLVGERPVSDPATVPSLVDATGRLHPGGMGFALRWLGGRIRAVEARREIRAQIERAAALGVRLTHLDSHDHVHVLPGLFEIVIEEMERAGLRRLRIPLETGARGRISLLRRGQGLALRRLARRAARLARRRGLAFPDHYLGFRAAGHVDAGLLAARLDALAEGVTELTLHPAVGAAPPREDFASWGYDWQDELAALLDPAVRRRLAEGGIRALRFDALPWTGEAVPERIAKAAGGRRSGGATDG